MAVDNVVAANKAGKSLVVHIVVVINGRLRVCDGHSYVLNFLFSDLGVLPTGNKG